MCWHYSFAVIYHFNCCVKTLAGSTHFLPVTPHNIVCWNWCVGFPMETQSRHKSHMSSWSETEQSSAMVPPLSLSLALYCLCLSHSFPFEFLPAGSCFTAARITARLFCWWTRLIVNRKGCEILSAKELPAWFTVGWMYVMLFFLCFLGDDWSNLAICLTTVGFLLSWFYLKLSFHCGLQAHIDMIQ